jgi:hypothetical protein
MTEAKEKVKVGIPRDQRSDILKAVRERYPKDSVSKQTMTEIFAFACSRAEVNELLNEHVKDGGLPVYRLRAMKKARKSDPKKTITQLLSIQSWAHKAKREHKAKNGAKSKIVKASKSQEAPVKTTPTEIVKLPAEAAPLLTPSSETRAA